MAAELDSAVRGQIVSSVGWIDLDARRRVAHWRRPSHPNSGTRQAHWFVETVGDRAVTASRREEPDPHRGRERHSEMDSTASTWRPSAWGIKGRPANAERGAVGENESSSGYSLSTKTRAQGDGDIPGHRRQGRVARGETGGNPSPAPGSSDAIYRPRRPGSKQPSGARHRDAASAFSGIRWPGNGQPDARRQNRTAVFTRRPGTRQPSSGARRQGDAIVSNSSRGAGNTSKTNLPM